MARPSEECSNQLFEVLEGWDRYLTQLGTDAFDRPDAPANDAALKVRPSKTSHFEFCDTTKTMVRRRS